MSQFFKLIEPVVGSVDLQFNIKSKDGIITVMVTPKAAIKDSAYSNIKPLVVSGTAEELDTEFVAALIAPMEKAAGIISNIAQFEAGAEKLNKESDAVKKQKDQEKKDKEQKGKKLSALIVKADGFEKENQLKSAIGCLTQAKEFSDKPADLDKRINELTAKLSQGSIFAQAADEPDPTNYLDDFKEEEQVVAEGPDDDDEENDNQEGGDE